MVKQGVGIVSALLRAQLQAALDSLAVGVTVRQFVDPFTDDKVELFDYPGVVINIAPFKSPAAEFKVFEKADVTLPMVVEFVTRDPDSAQARGSVSDVVRAILHVLNEAVIDQATVEDVRLLDVQELEFDFIRTDGDGTGGAVYFHAILRDYTP